MGGGAKGQDYPGLFVGSTDVLGRGRVDEPKSKVRSFVISKWEVWEAYRKVKASRGSRRRGRSVAREPAGPYGFGPGPAPDPDRMLEWPIRYWRRAYLAAAAAPYTG
jgi:hypothetical protein